MTVAFPGHFIDRFGHDAYRRQLYRDDGAEQKKEITN